MLGPLKDYPCGEGIADEAVSTAEKDVKTKATKPEGFANLGFVKELDQSGYVDSRYRKK